MKHRKFSDISNITENAKVTINEVYTTIIHYHNYMKKNIMISLISIRKIHATEMIQTYITYHYYL